MYKPDLIFRADGNALIGMGHLVRSMALAQMLKSLFRIHFYSIEAPTNFIKEVADLHFYFFKIETEGDFVEVIKYGDTVVIDHYQIDVSIHTAIRAKGARLVCIDDLHDRPFDADLIINHAPGVESCDYEAKKYSKFALGPNFAILRPEFLKAALKRPKRNFNRRLLICFGGSDFNNLTCKAVGAIKMNLFFEEIFVITGVSFSFRHQLDKQVNLDNRIKWFENLSAKEMVEYMQKCQYVLAPSSSIAYELLAVGCTWLGGYYVDNQKKIYEGFKKLNFLVDMGDLNKNLISFLSKYDGTQSQYLNKENPIDGKSDLRIKELFNSYVSSITC